MREPRKLMDGDATQLERQILASWAKEQPSPRARAAVLGLAAGTGVVAGAATAQGATLGHLAAPKMAATVGGWALGKAVVIGAVAGLATVGGAEVVFREGGDSAGVRAVVTPALAPSVAQKTRPAGRGKVVVPVEPSAVPEGMPVAPPSQAAVPPRSGARPEPMPAPTPPSTVPTAPGSTLLAEVASIDRARSTLAGGRAAEALAKVEAYFAEFPSGALGQEAALLRIEALVKLGRRAEAEPLGRAFLDAHPTSAHGSRVRELIHP